MRGLALVLSIALAAAGQVGEDGVPAVDSVLGRPPASEAEIEARELLARAIAELDRRRSVTSRLRMRVDAFEQRLDGSGTYAQGPKGSNLLKIDLVWSVADGGSALRHVCDGRYVWTYRESGSGSSLVRVDVRQVAQTASEQHQNAAQVDAVMAQSLGGLPAILRSFGSQFELGPVRKGKLGKLEVWVLDGTRGPPAGPAERSGTGNTSGASPTLDFSQSPECAPDRGLVFLDRESLFPFRLELRRKTGNQEGVDADSGVQRDRPIVTMDWYEVALDVPIDPAQFAYQPGNVEVSDQTGRVLKRLGLGGP